jgi:hypothetical protein
VRRKRINRLGTFLAARTVAPLSQRVKETGLAQVPGGSSNHQASYIPVLVVRVRRTTPVLEPAVAYLEAPCKRLGQPSSFFLMPGPPQLLERPSPIATPRWVPLLDWLTVAALVLAVVVLTFGGFRELVGGVLVSVRSWERPAGLALLLACVRHALVRRPALSQVVGGQFGRFWRSEARRESWPAFLATRLAVLLAGYLGVVTIGIAPGTERFRVSNHELENLPGRWDTGWYLGIATDGYQWDGNQQRQQNVVFFPAFPTAIWIVGLFFGEQWLRVALALALGAFFFALMYLYRLARDLLDGDRARTAVWALAAYPFSVYYSAPYTEAFYLLGAVATFYHLTNRQWWRAALWGFFVALSRPNGFLIAVPAAIFGIEQMRRQRRLQAAACAPVIAPLLGVLTYSMFLYVRFGDLLAWRKGQLAWGRAYPGVWPSLRTLWMDRYTAIWHGGLYDYTVANPYDFMYTAAAVLALASVWPTSRRFGIPYGVFTVVNIVPPMLVGGMMSIGRMTSVLFPVFLWLGAVLPSRYAAAWIAMSCVLQGLIAVLFFTWRPVF